MEWRSVGDLNVHEDLSKVFPVNTATMTAISDDMDTNGYDESCPITLGTGPWADGKEWIVDGHTRHQAASLSTLEDVAVVVKYFDRLIDAIGYAVKVQKDRRNLTEPEIYNCVKGLLDMKKSLGGWRGNRYTKTVNSSKSSREDLLKRGSYSYKIAEIMGISRSTVERIDYIERSGDEDIKRKVSSGEMGVKTGYNILRGRVPRSERTQKRAEIVNDKGCITLIDAVSRGDISISGAADIAQLPHDLQEDLLRDCSPNEAIAQARTMLESRISESQDREGLLREADAVRGRAFSRVRGTNNVADWVWNPITGCDRDCTYCYAKWQAHVHYAEAIPEPSMRFRPRLRRELLTAPLNTHLPIVDVTEPSRKVWVCDMGDLLSEGVPGEWVDEVIEAIRKGGPDWTYLISTRNPIRYFDFKWPFNCWLGVSTSTQEEVDAALPIMERLGGWRRFACATPLLEPISICPGDIYDVFDWLIIGPRLKTEGVDFKQPQWEWVWDVTREATESGVRVYWKENLHVRPTQYPV